MLRVRSRQRKTAFLGFFALQEMCTAIYHQIFKEGNGAEMCSLRHPNDVRVMAQSLSRLLLPARDLGLSAVVRDLGLSAVVRASADMREAGLQRRQYTR